MRASNCLVAVSTSSRSLFATVVAPRTPRQIMLNYLFSTVFAATAANARLFADAVSVFKFKKYQNDDERHYMVKVGCVVLLVLSFLIFAFFGKPVTLVFMGAFAQGALLPFLAFAAIYFLYTRVDLRLHPGKLWKVFLILSAICMALIGAYGSVGAINKTFFASESKIPPIVESNSTIESSPNNSQADK